MADEQWLLSKQLEDDGVPWYMVYRWGAHLEEHGLARKLGGQRGLWLISPAGVRFLQSRRGKIGRPPK